MTQPTLASFIAMPESSYNNILQAREALQALAYLSLEVSEKSLGHPTKDGYLALPAGGLCSLLLCIYNNMDTVGSEFLPSLVKRFPTTEGETA